MQEAELLVQADAEPWSNARLSLADHRRFAAYIQNACGIFIPPSKHGMLEARLRRRLRALRLPSFRAYYEYLVSPATGPRETVEMVDEVTTNKTDFYREPAHFNYLAQRVVPEFLGNGAPGERNLAVWSAGCSSGEEPYTLAMILAELAHNDASVRYRVLGTDICTEMLAMAQRAVYPLESIEPIPPWLRYKYFLRSKDRAAGLARVVPELRRAVSLRRLNLTDPDYGMNERFDVAFCRNVLIYFERATQMDVCDRIIRCLRPGGFLFIGHSETLQGMALPVKQVAPTVYRKEP